MAMLYSMDDLIKKLWTQVFQNSRPPMENDSEKLLLSNWGFEADFQ